MTASPDEIEKAFTHVRRMQYGFQNVAADARTSAERVARLRDADALGVVLDTLKAAIEDEADA